MPHYQNLTRLVFLIVSIVLYLLAIMAKIQFSDEVNGWGFATGAIAILALLPWHKLNKSNLVFTTKPEWLAVGVGLCLATIWLWVY